MGKKETHKEMMAFFSLPIFFPLHNSSITLIHTWAQAGIYGSSINIFFKLIIN